MTSLKYSPSMSERVLYPDDCARIQSVLAKIGHQVSIEQAHFMWEQYSDSMCAGWMTLPIHDTHLIEILVKGTEMPGGKQQATDPAPQAHESLPQNPYVGDGRLWNGVKWLEVAPSMEALAVVALSKENENARALIGEMVKWLREASFLLARFSRLGQHPDDRMSVDLAVDEASDIRTSRWVLDQIRATIKKVPPP